MKLVVDRIEGKIAVCENEKNEIIEIKISDFIETPKDGDIVILDSKGKYRVERDETEKNKKRMQERLNSLFK